MSNKNVFDLLAVLSKVHSTSLTAFMLNLIAPPSDVQHSLSTLMNSRSLDIPVL